MLISSAGSVPPSPMPVDLNTPGGQPYRTLNHKRSQPLMKSVLTPLVSLLPRIRGRSRRSNAFADEGLIAPRTPVRGSPLHSPVSMGNINQSGYFPWNGSNDAEGGGGPSYVPMSHSSSNTLTPESARNIPPGPPRRVQSEAQLTKGNTNPRGLATRNGLPVVPDSALSDVEGGEGGTRAVGLGSGGRKDISRPTSPGMRLATGNERVGGE